MQFLSSKYFTSCFPVLELCSVVNSVICSLVGRSPNDESSLEASGRGLVEVMYGYLPGGNEKRRENRRGHRFSGRDSNVEPPEFK